MSGAAITVKLVARQMRAHLKWGRVKWGRGHRLWVFGALFIVCAALGLRALHAETLSGAMPPVMLMVNGGSVGGGQDERNAVPVRVQLAALHSTVLSSEIAARIDYLEIREGDAFKEGATLVAFDCAGQRARLAKAKAAREAALRTAQVKRRLQNLNSVGLLEVEVAIAEAAQAEAEVDAMSAVVAHCTIAAPFTGRVADLKVRKHQFASEGQALMEILSDGALEAEMIVPSRWLAWLVVDAPLLLAIEETETLYPARVSRIGARIDSISQSVKVFARLEGRFPELLPGMSGSLRF